MAKPKEVKNGSDWMEKERRVNEAIERSDIKKDVVDREREKSSSSREEKRNAEWRVETEDKLSKEKDRGVSRKSSDRGEAKGGTRGHSLELERDYDQQEEMSHSNEGQSVHSEHRMPRPAEDRGAFRTSDLHQWHENYFIISIFFNLNIYPQVVSICLK